MRIIDVQQILMQEPRVAFKNAELIAVDEHMKRVVKEIEQREQEKRRSTVTKIEESVRRERVQDSMDKKKFIRHAGERPKGAGRHKIDYII